MRKKILAIICLVAIGLGLTACSQSTDNQSKEESSQSEQKLPFKLTTKNLTLKRQAAAIVIYAAKKYKGVWQKTYSQALKNDLSVSVKSSTGFNNILKKQDYIYEVSGNGKENDAFYCIKGSSVSLYNHKKKLATVSLKQILSYLNDNQQAERVKKLDVVMGASITSNKYGIKGDNGLAFIPKKLQGTWYNKKGKKLVITEHTINHEEIHKISSSGVTTTTFNQTKNWARARIENINGINCYHVQSLNTQDFGLLYTVQKSGNNVAVVTYSVDTGNYLSSYWKTTKIAKDNQDAKFKSLN